VPAIQQGWDTIPESKNRRYAFTLAQRHRTCVENRGQGKGKKSKEWSSDSTRVIHTLEIIPPVAIVSGWREQWIFAVGEENEDGLIEFRFRD